MRVRSNAIRAGLAALLAALAAPKAQAQIFGGPKPGEIGFLPANHRNRRRTCSGSTTGSCFR